MSTELIIIAIILAAFSGIPALWLPRSSPWGQRIATSFMTVSSLIGLTGVGIAFGAAPVTVFTFPWPALGNSLVGVDALSAFFLVPILVVGGLGSIYG
ncbi:MAG: hypothetical protein EOM70_13120, partial [Clostridia bacterium]|nr:hypothetical protein [Clostridia bacterium]